MRVASVGITNNSAEATVVGSHVKEEAISAVASVEIIMSSVDVETSVADAVVLAQKVVVAANGCLLLLKSMTRRTSPHSAKQETNEEESSPPPLYHQVCF